MPWPSTLLWCTLLAMAHNWNPQHAAVVGARIRELRKAAGITSQDELAARAHVDRTYIGRLERGECGVTLASLLVIFDALSVSITEFFGPIEKQLRLKKMRSGTSSAGNVRSNR